MADLRLAGALRPSRRYAPLASQPRAGPTSAAPCAARSVPAASRCGARGSSHDERPRRLVLLSTSAGRWSRTPARCCASSTPRWSAARRVEAFALGTRLTRITRELTLARSRRGARGSGGRGHRLVRRHSTRRRLARVQRRVGHAGHGRGRHRGDPLRRLGAGRPRASWPSRWRGCPGRPSRGVGEPAEGVARLRAAGPGMAAALPYVDDFVEGHSLAALEELAQVISK